jgi:hypothetical protein
MPIQILIPEVSEIEPGHTLRFETPEGTTGKFKVISAGFTVISAEHPGGGLVHLSFTMRGRENLTRIYPRSLLKVNDEKIPTTTEEILHCWYNDKKMF